jgi:hypothetical protein
MLCFTVFLDAKAAFLLCLSASLRRSRFFGEPIPAITFLRAIRVLCVNFIVHRSGAQKKPSYAFTVQ